jgi:hypothetical protein
MESQIINGRKVTAFSCYYNNIPKNIVESQKKIFDKFNMHINQEKTNHHASFLNSIMKNSDLDICVICDIDAIPLKNGIYEYIVEQISDDNSIIGPEQAPNHIDYKQIYAGVTFMGLTSKVYEKLGRPTFQGVAGRCDTGGELTIAAKKVGVNIKYFYIKSSLDKIWRCGDKYFGHGTTYEDWYYHQFEMPTLVYQIQFISKCNQILKK